MSLLNIFVIFREDFSMKDAWVLSCHESDFKITILMPPKFFPADFLWKLTRSLVDSQTMISP